MSHNDDSDYWKFWLLVFIVAIVILTIALFCKIFIFVGAVLGISGAVIAIISLCYNDYENLKLGVISEFVGLILLILGNTIYNFLVEYGLIAFAQEILKIIPFIS